MRPLKVLISGAGIAGCTLAYWLARHGHVATVVERGGALRSSGSPIDVRGPAMRIAEQMGIVPRLREASTRVGGLTVLDRDGRRAAHVDLDGLRRSIGVEHVELPRGDLSAILHEAGRDSAEYVFGDSIRSLTQESGGVDVAFERAAPRRFDLVIGADGLHSRVRRLAFGPEASFVRHAGLYVATLPLPRSLDAGPDITMLSVPGKSVTVHPSRASPLAAFIFWHPAIAAFDHADSGQHKRLLQESFADIGWKVPEILDAALACDELYFDAVSRVDLPDWARGRTVLVGDAASCVSLFGDGTTLAIAGAHALATALAEQSDDHEAAFRQYKAQHGKLVGPKMRNVGLVASMLVPRTRFGVSLRNRAMGLAQAYVAVKRLGRRLRFA